MNAIRKQQKAKQGQNYVIIFGLADDFKTVFKVLIYSDIKRYPLVNVIDFSGNGRDSMRKEVNPILFH